MAEKFEALKRARQSGSTMDFWGNNQPKCPHCGTTCNISDNEWWRLYEEGEHDVTCPSCDGDFTVSVRVSFSFDTEDQEEDDDDDDEEPGHD